MSEIVRKDQYINEDKIEAAIEWLDNRKQDMQLQMTIHAAEIGEYLINNFFDGDINRVRSHNPTKNASFRKLCEREDLPFTMSSLRTFLQVAINFRVLPEHVASALLPSCHSILYRVADPAERCEIAEDAIENNRSVRELQKIVKGKGRRRPGGGRKEQTTLYKELKAALGIIANIESQMKRKPADSSMANEMKEIKARLAKLIKKVDIHL